MMLAAAMMFAAPALATDVGGLRCEFMKTPLGIDDAQPALSWTIQDDRRGVVQTAYRVLVASSEALLAQDQGDLWDSGEVASDRSYLVIYKGKPLVSRECCFLVAAFPPPTWARDELKTALEGQGATVRVIAKVADAAAGEFCVVVGLYYLVCRAGFC